MRSILVTLIIGLVLFASTLTLAEDKVVVIPLASSQSSKQGWIDLNIISTHLSGVADILLGHGELAGINLPTGGIANVAHSFVIPKDYKTGNELTINILWHTSSMNCTAQLFTDFLSVTRDASTPITGVGGAAGLSIEDNGILTADTQVDHLVQQTAITITSPDPLVPLQAHDAIVFGFNRNSLSPEDTCAGSVMITAMTVSY